MKYLLLLLPMFLSGCFDTIPVRPALQETDPGRIQVTPQDQLPCPPLPAPPEGPLSEEAAGLLLVNWANLYQDCSDAKDRIFEIIKQLNAES